MNNYLKIVLGLIFIAFLTGCRDDIQVIIEKKAERVGTEDNWVIYKEETVAVNEQTDEVLSKVGDNNLIFDRMTDQLDDLDVGGIIVSGATVNAPRGYLRKITEIEEKNGQIVYTTESASWPEAFEEFNIDLSSSFEGVKGKTGGVFTGLLDNLEFTLPSNLEYHPGGRDDVTVIPRVNAEFAGDIVAKFVGDSNGITEIQMGVKNFKVVSCKVELTVQYSGLAADGLVFSKDDPLWQEVRGLGPIPIGPAIVVEPVIQLGVFSSLTLGATGRVGVDFSSNRYDSFVTYTPANGWVTTTTPVEYSSLNPFIQIEGEARVDAGVILGVGFAPYSAGLVSMGINSRLGLFSSLKGEANFSPPSAASVFSVPQIIANTTTNGCFALGLTAGAGVFLDVPLLGIFGADPTTNVNLLGYEKSLIKECLNAPCNNFGEFSFDFICNGIQPQIAISAGEGVFTNDLAGYYILDKQNDTITLSGLKLFQYNQSYLIPTQGFDVSNVKLVDVIDPACKKSIIVSQVPCEFTSNASCSTVIHDDREAFAEGDYCVVEINGREWLAQNLDYGSRQTPEVGRCYSSSQVDCGELGRLYTYDEVEAESGNFNSICPTGYRIPTLAEWGSLTDFIGGSANAYKLMSEVGWSIEPQARNNQYGFDAKPGGFFGSTNPNVQNKLGPQGIGQETYFWTSSESRSDPSKVWAFQINNNKQIKNALVSKDWGAYCRCINDQ